MNSGQLLGLITDLLRDRTASYDLDMFLVDTDKEIFVFQKDGPHFVIEVSRSHGWRSTVAERAHERSPWRIAFETVMASRGSSSETVTLKVNAKGEVQPEVTAVRRDGESLLEAYARAADVLRVARAEHSPSAADLPFQGLTEPHEDAVPF